MILTAGLVAGTFAFASQATPLHPYNIDRQDNSTTMIYVGHDTTINLSHTERFEIIAYNDQNRVLTAEDGATSVDLKAKKGQRVFINANTGFGNNYYKIGNVVINVDGFQDYMTKY